MDSIKIFPVIGLPVIKKDDDLGELIYRAVTKQSSLIEEDDVIRTILKHWNLWKEPAPMPPQLGETAPAETGPYYDFTFIEPA